MSRFNKGLIVVLVAFLGVWGCAQGPAPSSAQANRIKELETQYAKVSEDNRTLLVARDQFRKQIAALEQDKAQGEEQRGLMQKELDRQQLIVKERDHLRQELEAKTALANTMQTRAEKLRTILKNAISEDDAMLNTTGPALTTTLAPTGGQ